MSRIGLLLTAAVLLAPLASAQPSTGPGVEFEVAENDPNLPDGRLIPESSVAEIALKVSLSCPVRHSMLPTRVEFSVTSTAPYASVVFNPDKGSVQIPPERCADFAYRAVFEAKAIVTTSREAPAMQEFVTEISALVIDEYGEYGPATGSFNVTNDYLPLAIANPGTLFAKAGPNKRIPFIVEVSNLGNGPTRISSEIVHPQKERLPRVEPGAVLNLQSRSIDGASAKYREAHEIQAWTPKAGGYTNAIYEFQVIYTASYDGNVTGTPLKDVQSIAYAVQVQGVGTPNVGLFAILFAIAAGVALHRRP